MQAALPDLVATLAAAGCVFAEEEAELLASAAETPEDLRRMVDLRCAGMPLEPILGWVGFCGMRLAIEPGVFVPRHRTEFLVQQAATLAGRRDTVVDLCCGCGAVGAALATMVGDLRVHATDLEPAAVSCARQNLASLGGHAYQGDLYDPLPRELQGRVDIVVASAPYVPTAAIRLLPREARLYEPKVTLDGGEDGLDVARRIAEDAKRWLSPRGHLLIETSEQQAPELARVFARHGLAPRIARDDTLDATVVIGSVVIGAKGTA